MYIAAAASSVGTKKSKLPVQRSARRLNDIFELHERRIGRPGVAGVHCADEVIGNVCAHHLAEGVVDVHNLRRRTDAIALPSPALMAAKSACVVTPLASTEPMALTWARAPM